MTTKTLSEIEAELVKANARYTAAKVAQQEAQRELTAATNHLNFGQKAFDERVAEMRKAAPRDSDWNRSPSQIVQEMSR